jgi:mRNA interferase YafQ
MGEAVLSDLLRPVLKCLVRDVPLDIRLHDHALKGNRHGLRECHLKPDLLLMYAKPDDETLLLAGLGSHAYLFKR